MYPVFWSITDGRIYSSEAGDFIDASQMPSWAVAEPIGTVEDLKRNLVYYGFPIPRSIWTEAELHADQQANYTKLFDSLRLRMHGCQASGDDDQYATLQGSWTYLKNAMKLNQDPPTLEKGCPICGGRAELMTKFGISQYFCESCNWSVD